MALFDPNIKKMEEKGDIEGLSQALRYEKDATREKAAFALDRLASEPQDDANKAWYLVAKRNWQKLAELGEPALAPLVLALQHSEEGVRIAAGDALEKIALSYPDSAVPLLCEALCNQFIALNPKITQVRNRTVEILGKMGDVRVVIPLVRSANKIGSLEFDQQRSRGQHPSKMTSPQSDAYRNLVKQVIKEIGEPAISPLIEAVTSNQAEFKDIEYYHVATYLLVIGTPVVDPLIKLLDSDNGKVRSAAISLLGRFDDDRINDILVKSLRDCNQSVRESAASDLRSRSWQPTNPEENTYFLLTELLASNTVEGGFSITKMDEFLALGEEAVNPLVRSLNLEGKLWERGYSVAFGLKVAPSYYEARQFITHLLVKIGRSAIPALEKALDDPDPIIRQEAHEALKRLKKGISTAIRPATSAATADDKKPKPTAGYILAAAGALLLLASMILCISLPIVVTAGDITNDPTMSYLFVACCALPLLLIGIVLFIIGLIKIFRK